MPSERAWRAQAKGLAAGVAALQGQLAKLEGDDLLAVQESAALCTSLAALLARPPPSWAPPSVAPGSSPGAGTAQSPGLAGGGQHGSSTGSGAPAEAQPPLLLGAP